MGKARLSAEDPAENMVGCVMLGAEQAGGFSKDIRGNSAGGWRSGIGQ